MIKSEIVLTSPGSGFLSFFLLFVMIFSAVIGSLGCSAQPPQLSVEDQYAVLSPMFLGSGSIFMKIRNAGGRDALVSARANLAGSVVELHDIDGNRMVKTEKIAIPSKGTADLKPGGSHLMLFHMPRSVKEDSEIVLTLKFEKSGEIQIPVRFVNPKRISVQGG